MLAFVKYNMSENSKEVSNRKPLSHLGPLTVYLDASTASYPQHRRSHPEHCRGRGR